jgi:hypothetical protein
MKKVIFFFRFCIGYPIVEASATTHEDETMNVKMRLPGDRQGKNEVESTGNAKGETVVMRHRQQPLCQTIRTPIDDTAIFTPPSGSQAECSGCGSGATTNCA